MIKRGILAIGTMGLILASCIKHEVIPAPVPMVDLYAHFYGVIDGVPTELTENVLGYSNLSTKAKIILPPPSFSSAVYYSELSSPEVATSIKIGMGSVNWDASLSPDPALNSFNTFFLAETLPAYSNSGASGFEVTYRDGVGAVWTSDDASVAPMDVEFTGITQESDSTGDYSLFTCYFNCDVYRTYYDPVLMMDVTESLTITDGVYEGWFKRD